MTSLIRSLGCRVKRGCGVAFAWMFGADVFDQMWTWFN